MKAKGKFNIIMLPREKYTKTETLLELELYVNSSVSKDLYNKFGVVCRLGIEEIEENNHQSWSEFTISNIEKGEE